jgi:hypothetical protein
MMCCFLEADVQMNQIVARISLKIEYFFFD